MQRSVTLSNLSCQYKIMYYIIIRYGTLDSGEKPVDQLMSVVCCYYCSSIKRLELRLSSFQPTSNIQQAGIWYISMRTFRFSSILCIVWTVDHIIYTYVCYLVTCNRNLSVHYIQYIVQYMHALYICYM